MNQKEFYNTLSEDVKNKIKACKSQEEMMQVLSQEGIALDDELLDSVSGGFDFHNVDICNSDKKNKC